MDEAERVLILSLRQEEILARVVEGYVATGAPVGSKTLVERDGVGASPSTVRNELAVLEEHGLLTHPHTSAGRVPTDTGYRAYVDRVHRPARAAPRFGAAAEPAGGAEPRGRGAPRDDGRARAGHAPARARVCAAAGDDERPPRRVDPAPAAARHGCRDHVHGWDLQAPVRVRRAGRLRSRRVGTGVPERAGRGTPARGAAAAGALRGSGALRRRARVPRRARPGVHRARRGRRAEPVRRRGGRTPGRVSPGGPPGLPAPARGAGAARGAPGADAREPQLEGPVRPRRLRVRATPTCAPSRLSPRRTACATATSARSASSARPAWTTRTPSRSSARLRTSSRSSSRTSTRSSAARRRPLCRSCRLGGSPPGVADVVGFGVSEPAAISATPMTALPRS